MITLIDGRQVNPDSIQFDPGSYRFTLNSEDVTNQVKRADKVANWYAFDIARDNDRLYVQRYMSTHHNQPPPEVGSDSFITNLYNQLITNPLDAPLDALDDFVTNTVDRILVSSGLQTIGLILLAAGIGYLVFFAPKPSLPK